MSRIIIPTNTLVGRKLLELTTEIIDVSQRASRLKAIVDQITANGATPANLETPTGEAQMPANQGATIYAGIASIKTALDGLAGTVSVIDQG